MKHTMHKRLILAATILACAPRVHGDATEAQDETPAPIDAELLLKEPKIVEKSTMIVIKNIIRDAGTQARVSLDMPTIERYRDVCKDAVKAGQPIPLPPILVVRSSEGKLYLIDGFQRTEAHEAAKLKEIEATIIEPPKGVDAVKYAVGLSLGANATHGKPRTTADTQRAVYTVLREFPHLSNIQKGQLAHVSEATIRYYEDKMPKDKPKATTKTVQRKGKTITMKTANIGKRGGSGGSKAPKVTGTGAKPKKTDEKQDQALRAAIIKITDAQSGDKAAREVRGALEANTLALSTDEIIKWGELPKDQRAAITPYVVDNRWKPSKAIEFLNQELDGKSKLEDIALLLVAGPEKLIKAAGLRIEFSRDDKGKAQVVMTLDPKQEPL